MSSGGISIRIVDDPKIHLVDQFLKIAMDGLKRNHAQMLADTVYGSPLHLLQIVIDDILEFRKKNGSSVYRPHAREIPTDLLFLLRDRVTDDRQLVEQFKAGGQGKMRAATMLKQRGLLSG